ncbi:MAG: SDR family oxidoreductase [Proteobacteria bacterium]|jgi:3(or 17)beta-hydroxysteroid dehydrogenase|nr:SDR family oxidoreductase [Pseudomonadota bacterium]HOL36481.1 SDR family oxidoreductase [Rubrivivax sp.]
MSTSASPRQAGKVALVTGGASGVGKATALLLASEGASVVLTDVNEEGGRAVAAAIGSQALFVRHDVASEEDWAAVLAQARERFGALDVLVNNAGILAPGDIESQTLDSWHRLLRVNADSVFLGTQAGVKAMKERGGSIVNVASVSSWMPIDGYCGYAASKAAVAAVTRSAALHCRKRGYAVRVNSVHPDGIWTPMMEESTRAIAPGVRAEHVLFDPKRNPKGRACRPEEVAATIAFLASDDARAISGAELRVDNAILGMGL